MSSINFDSQQVPATLGDGHTAEPTQTSDCSVPVRDDPWRDNRGSGIALLWLAFYVLIGLFALARHGFQII